MIFDTARLTASYEMQTEAFGIRMDAAAVELGNAYGAKLLGVRLDWQSRTRSLEWETSVNRAQRAEADLVAMGFETRLDVVSEVGAQ